MGINHPEQEFMRAAALILLTMESLWVIARPQVRSRTSIPKPGHAANAKKIEAQFRARR